MMRITVDADAMSILAEGHAGYAPAGQDIVCAGVSAILDTLYERLMSKGCLQEDSVMGAGYAFIHAIDCDASHWYLDYAAAGLDMIAEAYPDHVAVDVVV